MKATMEADVMPVTDHEALWKAGSCSKFADVDAWDQAITAAARPEVEALAAEIRELAGRAISEGFEDFSEGVSHPDGRSVQLLEALMVLRHLRPGRMDMAAFAHRALTGFLIDALQDRGYIGPTLAALTLPLFNYADSHHCEYRDGAWHRRPDPRTAARVV